MTLDEVIKHCEEVVDLCEDSVSKYDMTDALESHFACQDGECAEKHRQLAEWLRELKRLKEQEPCEDAISRKVVLNKIKEVCFSREKEWIDFRVSQGSNGQRDFIIKFIESLPPVTPKPKTGHWNTYELAQGGINEKWLECSECMWSNALLIPRNYCPKCGARMMEKEDDKE